MSIDREHHCKYLIQLLQGDLRRKPRRKQRSRSYGPQVDDALRVIHESFDYICAEHLTPNLVWVTETKCGRSTHLPLWSGTSIL
jgi:hypothetical protein